MGPNSKSTIVWQSASKFATAPFVSERLPNIVRRIICGFCGSSYSLIVIIRNCALNVSTEITGDDEVTSDPCRHGAYTNEKKKSFKHIFHTNGAISSLEWQSDCRSSLNLRRQAWNNEKSRPNVEVSEQKDQKPLISEFRAIACDWCLLTFATSRRDRWKP